MQARALLLSALVALPGTVLAQDTPDDSTSFHGGQWAVQFGGGLNLFNLGALRFTSPKRAWLLDVGVSAVIVNGKLTDNFGGGTTKAHDHFTAVNARLGKRFYGGGRGKVAPFHSLALEGGYQNREVAPVVGARQVINQWYAGLYWEVGASYRIAPSLSVGGTGSISGGYLHQKQEDAASTFKGHGFYLDGVQVQLVVGIYF